eukprot:1148259-Pelagomonas_calceolata.AAC.1
MRMGIWRDTGSTRLQNLAMRSITSVANLWIAWQLDLDANNFTFCLLQLPGKGVGIRVEFKTNKVNVPVLGVISSESRLVGWPEMEHAKTASGRLWCLTEEPVTSVVLVGVGRVSVELQCKLGGLVGLRTRLFKGLQRVKGADFTSSTSTPAPQDGCASVVEGDV